ncbi:TetR/AcrR family transcriptional regulator [Nocardia terpenica]|uniref:TetR/AcrR family transcriptional regulator n=1 Tax=Nocardia terpenica TaxID=455432 RepID=UPI002FE0CBA4
MPSLESSDGRRARGDRTRSVVLEAAVRQASTDGLDGLSLARLASGLGISKSALFTHWPDKQSLQLAVIEQANDQWKRLVVIPALEGQTGLAALRALMDSRLAFYAEPVLPGRCFFVATQAEFDDHPGPVRDRLRTLLRDWEALLCTLIRTAIDAGELPADTDPAELAYELDALGQTVVTRSRLLDSDTVFAHARASLHARLTVSGG